MNTTTLPGPKSAHVDTAAAHGGFDYPPFFDRLARELTLSDAVVITTLPRGELQITQSLRPADYLLKAYGRELHDEDRATWQAILTGQVLTGEEAWGHQAFPNCRFRVELMLPAGLTHVMAAPLTAPVLKGYPGALHVYRTPEQGPFSPADKAALRRLAEELNARLQEERDARLSESCRLTPTWTNRPAQRQFIFDADLNLVVGDESFAQIDERLRQQIQQHARQCLQSVNGKNVTADRLQLPDERGDLWTFRVVVRKHYPALGGNGPFVFFCLQPDCCDWSVLRAADFQAEPEMARLVPSLKFMQDNFHAGPGLGEIARTAHLSPFHFHRRFSELMGLTPKHFLLECQIFVAKRQLMQRHSELTDIARSCGFAHQSHFTSRFKQAAGLTPTRWRRLVADRMRPRNPASGNRI